MEKNGKLILIAGIMLALTFGYNLGLFTVGYQDATTYNSWNADLNEMELTYSSTSTEALRANAFKSLHVLSLDAGANDFEVAEQNKRFWRFFLKSNDVDPNNFKDAYSNTFTSWLFRPINWEDLANLNFDESDNAWVYRSIVPVGEDIDKINNLGFYWDYRGAWCGGYNKDILNDMASKMSCYVEGETTALAEDIYIAPDRSEPYYQNYKIYGDVYFDGDSFVCKVDTEKLFSQLPETFTRPSDDATVPVGGAGVDGKVVFYFGERIYSKYRFEDNQCNLLEVKLSDITQFDFDYLSECQENIINYIDIYRIENRKCNLISIAESDKQTDDYIDLLSCQNDLILSLYEGLSSDEISQIIILLNLSLEEKINILSELNLTLEDKESIVSQLTEVTEERDTLLELLEQENKLTLENLWKDYKVTMLIVSGLIFLLIIGGRKR